jgi:GNAT superfamily N-acetyltransferase
MTTNDLNFRLATVEDAAKLEHLINEAFRNDFTTQVFLSADHASVDVTNIPSIIAKIAQPDTVVLACINPDDTIVAHCSIRKIGETCAWFGLLAVDLLYQRRGVGSRVLAYAESFARKEWQSKRMEFDVVCTRAELIAWYQNQGYQATGETKPFPYEYHGDWNGVLRDDLYFITLGKDLI